MNVAMFPLLLVATIAAAQNNIAQVVNTHVSKGFNGVVLVADNGKIVYEQAFGYRTFADRAVLRASDIFELASVSKQFTSMIIMMLHEKGKLGYDDLVEKYLSIPYKGITIRNLLTHTSGLPDYQAVMDEHWDKSKVAGNDDILEYLNRYTPPKRFEPGARYEYSNTGYVLLASIAEKASGKDFVKMCRKWIFRPTGMKHTDIRTLKQKAAVTNFAIGHIMVSDRNEYVRADSFRSSDYTIWLGNRKGPGRVSSTAEDLLKWDQALYSNKLVKQSTLQDAFQPMKLTNDSMSYYGFGWVLRSNASTGKVVYHTGDNPGYATQIARYIDRGKTIIVLSNNAYNTSAIIRDLERVIF